jgi:hypothetical protein
VVAGGEGNYAYNPNTIDRGNEADGKTYTDNYQAYLKYYSNSRVVGLELKTDLRKC